MPENMRVTSSLATNLLRYALASGYTADGQDAWSLRRIEFYDGTKPATADTAITTQNLLVRITHPSNPWDGTVIVNADDVELRYRNDLVPGVYEYIADGTMTWFRVFSVEGHAMFDGTVGTSNADLVLNTTAVVSDKEVQLSKFNVVMPFTV